MNTPGVGAAPNGSDLPAGTPVGEYIIDSQLGVGGFGVVYRATHPLIGKVAAIKVLSRQYSADPDIVGRFVSEARAVNQIGHRNIVDIFSFGVLPDDRHYFVMEFLEGQSLGARLENGPLSLAEALAILEPIARALDAAHHHGIAHRDLKPDNIMLARDSDGEIFPKLLDFGVAKLLGNDGTSMHKTQTGMPIGTPYYMSPEQCRGRSVDQRTDIYSFGVLTYQVLTGAVPFEGQDFMEILLQQMNDDAPPASARAPALSGKVDNAIAWMMAKDPAQRPQTLAVAMDALAAAAQESGVALPARLAMRTPSTADLSRVLATPATTMLSHDKRITAGKKRVVGALVLAVVVLVAAVVVWQLQKSPAAETPVLAALPVDAALATDAPPMGVIVAPPSMVTITLVGAPAGTEVFGAGDVRLGVSPVVQLPRSSSERVLVLRAEGYLPTPVVVIPTSSQEVPVELEPRPAEVINQPGAGAKHGKGKKDRKGKRKKPGGNGSIDEADSIFRR